MIQDEQKSVAPRRMVPQGKEEMADAADAEEVTCPSLPRKLQISGVFLRCFWDTLVERCMLYVFTYISFKYMLSMEMYATYLYVYI